MLRTITLATDEPVSLDDAKAHLRVMHAQDDALIDGQITSAREWLEQVTGLALAEASYRYTGELRCIPIAPAEVTSIKALQPDNTWAVDPAVTYDADRNLLLGAKAEQHMVEFTTKPENVPKAICDAIKLRVQALYENENVDQLNEAAYQLAFPYRINLGC